MVVLKNYKGAEKFLLPCDIVAAVMSYAHVTYTLVMLVYTSLWGQLYKRLAHTFTYNTEYSIMIMVVLLLCIY